MSNALAEEPELIARKKLAINNTAKMMVKIFRFMLVGLLVKNEVVFRFWKSAFVYNRKKQPLKKL